MWFALSIFYFFVAKLNKHILTIDNGISPFLKLWEGQGHDLVNWELWKSSELTRNQTEAKYISNGFYDLVCTNFRDIPNAP